MNTLESIEYHNSGRPVLFPVFLINNGQGQVVFFVRLIFSYLHMQAMTRVIDLPGDSRVRTVCTIRLHNAPLAPRGFLPIGKVLSCSSFPFLVIALLRVGYVLYCMW